MQINTENKNCTNGIDSVSQNSVNNVINIINKQRHDDINEKCESVSNQMHHLAD